MKRAMLILSLPALLALAAGCSATIPIGSSRVVTGSGHSSSETRNVSNLNSVQLSGLGDLRITQGDTESLTVEAEDNLLPLITTEMQGRTLVIGLQKNTSIVPTQPIRYDLTLISLKGLTLSGAGNISADQLKADSLSITTSGAGNINLAKLQVSSVTARISGAGSLTLAGQASEESVTLSGLGNYSAGDLQCQTGSVTLSGAGNATVWTQSALDVRISGAGSVGYYGSPKVTQNVTGAGSVRSLGNK